MGETQLEDVETGGNAAGAVPLRVIASALGERCRAEGVRAPSLRTLRFWRDQGLIDAPSRLGFDASHLSQALTIARARAAGATLAEVRSHLAETADAGVGSDVASDVSQVQLSGVAAGGCDTGAGLGGRIGGSYNGPIGCTTPPFNSTIIPGGLPTSPPNPYPWIQPHPEPWKTFPSTTTTFFPALSPDPHLDRVADALDEGDAEGALEQLDAVIRAALRDPDVDLEALRALRASLEDLIAEHRRALAALTDTLDELRGHDDATPGDATDDDSEAAPDPGADTRAYVGGGDVQVSFGGGCATAHTSASD